MLVAFYVYNANNKIIAHELFPELMTEDQVRDRFISNGFDSSIYVIKG